MGPNAVKQLSMWEYDAAVTGWSKANNPNDGNISAKEMDDLWEGVVARMN